MEKIEIGLESRAFSCSKGYKNYVVYQHYITITKKDKEFMVPYDGLAKFDFDNGESLPIIYGKKLIVTGLQIEQFSDDDYAQEYTPIGVIYLSKLSSLHTNKIKILDKRFNINLLFEIETGRIPGYARNLQI